MMQAAEVRREHGLGAAAKVLRAAVRRQWRSVHLLALSEPRPLPTAVDAANDHLFKFASPDDLRDIQRELPDAIGERDFEYLARGDRCLLQLDGGTLAGFAWVAGARLVHIVDGFHLNLPDDAVYNYHSYTAPAYRGYGFQALRHLKLLQMLEHEGKRRLFGFVDELNFKSLNGVIKSGYKRVGKLEITHRQGKVSVTLQVTADFWCDIRRT